SATVEGLLVLGWRKIAKRFEKAVVIEPPYPFEDGELHILQGAPGAALPDHLRLEETNYGLGQGVIVRVALAAHRRLNACFCEAFGVPNRQVLHATVAMVYQAVSGDFVSFIDCVLQGVQRKVAPQRVRHAPANDPP